jgi:hypothetical protein
LNLKISGVLKRSISQEVLRDGLAAGSVAAVLSGAPSTLHALLTDGDLLEGSLAAGTVLLPHERRATRLLPAAAAVHLTLSLGWALVLAAALPPKRTPALGGLAGLAIAALDLGVIGRNYPRIRALPSLPQVADHLAYGVTVGAVLRARRLRRG